MRTSPLVALFPCLAMCKAKVCLSWGNDVTAQCFMQAFRTASGLYGAVHCWGRGVGTIAMPAVMPWPATVPFQASKSPHISEVFH